MCFDALVHFFDLEAIGADIDEQFFVAGLSSARQGFVISKPSIDLQTIPGSMVSPVSRSVFFFVVRLRSAFFFWSSARRAGSLAQ